MLNGSIKQFAAGSGNGQDSEDDEDNFLDESDANYNGKNLFVFEKPSNASASGNNTFSF